VKPAPFSYHRAESLEDALEALGEGGSDTKLLAGGQSLLAAMNFRLARPARLVDIDRLPGLEGCSANDGQLRLGALERIARLEALQEAPWSAVGEAARHIGHLPIRLRGTVGGSIAHADPAAELVVCAAAYDAEVVVRSARAERRVGVADFFVAPFMTSIEPDEAVVEVVFQAPASARSAWEELAPRPGDYAFASACAVVDRERRTARIALGSVGGTPLRARSAEAVLEGAGFEPAAVDEAARVSAADCDPTSDSHADESFRRELVAVLVRRALVRAVGDTR
jgi:CO/xanthine dehydrogenase FAD-binding subunit